VSRSPQEAFTSFSLPLEHQRLLLPNVPSQSATPRGIHVAMPKGVTKASGPSAEFIKIHCGLKIQTLFV
jgi:hypothetical protein